MGVEEAAGIKIGKDLVVKDKKEGTKENKSEDADDNVEMDSMGPVPDWLKAELEGADEVWPGGKDARKKQKPPRRKPSPPRRTSKQAGKDRFNDHNNRRQGRVTARTELLLSSSSKRDCEKMRINTAARRHGGTVARRHGGTVARRHGGTVARRHGGSSLFNICSNNWL
ncbi:uncharacterized protein [Cherax quadricarinatus]|uniref:uncharacterized protein n=1 Tax=Cherax quadricarinatus TaxID=27406 RepID=UPI00387E6659